MLVEKLMNKERIEYIMDIKLVPMVINENIMVLSIQFVN